MTNADDGSLAKTEQIWVADVALTIDISGETATIERCECTPRLGNVIAPGADTVVGYSILWGDGQFEQFQVATVSGSLVTHVL